MNDLLMREIARARVEQAHRIAATARLRRLARLPAPSRIFPPYRHVHRIDLPRALRRIGGPLGHRVSRALRGNRHRHR